MLRSSRRNGPLADRRLRSPGPGVPHVRGAVRRAARARAPADPARASGRDVAHDGAPPRGVPQARAGRSREGPHALLLARGPGDATGARRPRAKPHGAQAGRRASGRDARRRRVRGRGGRHGADRDRHGAREAAGRERAARPSRRAALFRGPFGRGDGGGLDASTATVKRDWRAARAFLLAALSPSSP